ncbi:MAG: hypothetical protein IT513_12980 [Burkholderiales bacterium]|nr:hypothetical protein [Burkholderiales bacterium]
MRPAPALLAAAALAALTACAEVRWQKKDGDNSALANDLAACRKAGLERSMAMGTSIPRTEISPVFGPTGPSPADARMQEAQVVTACMREKGYALVPAAK